MSSWATHIATENTTNFRSQQWHRHPLQVQRSPMYFSHISFHISPSSLSPEVTTDNNLSCTLTDFLHSFLLGWSCVLWCMTSGMTSGPRYSVGDGVPFSPHSKRQLSGESTVSSCKHRDQGGFSCFALRKVLGKDPVAHTGPKNTHRPHSHLPWVLLSG